MKNFLIFASFRSLIGIVSVSVFFFLHMLSQPEASKLAGWMLLYGFGLAGLLSLFSNGVASYVIRFVWIVSCIDQGIRGFLRLYFGITPGIIEVFDTLQATSSQETREFVVAEWRLLLFSAAVSIVMIALTWFAEKQLLRRTSSVAATKTAQGTALVFFVLFCLAFFNPAMRNTNDFSFWYIGYHGYQSRLNELAQLQQSVSVDPAQLKDIHYVGTDNRTVVLIIGESLTRNNMSLYGYPRATTPLLDKNKSQLMVFNDVISGGYETAQAIPKLLTTASIQKEDDWKHTPSIILQAKAAGYKTFWVSNQLTFDGIVSVLSHQTDVQHFDNYGNDISESTFDEVLFPDVVSALKDPAPKKFIIVHLLGNHMRYHLRYPPSYNQFVGKTDAVTDAMHQAGRADWIIQTRAEYDNSILYNDMVVSHILGLVQKEADHTPAAFAYLSDHGQEVGQDRDVANHSAVDKSGWEIPLIMWMSQPLPQDKQVLENRPYQTDRFDATMLDLLSIRSPYYMPENDILSTQFVTKDRYMVKQLYQR